MMSLRKVVVVNGLQTQEAAIPFRQPGRKDCCRGSTSAGELNIDPGPKTSLISVTYESRDPKLAAAVLRTLGDAYLEKHMEVNRPHGQLAFFENSRRYETGSERGGSEAGTVRETKRDGGAGDRTRQYTMPSARTERIQVLAGAERIRSIP